LRRHHCALSIARPAKQASFAIIAAGRAAMYGQSMLAMISWRLGFNVDRFSSAFFFSQFVYEWYTGGIDI
jgi:hypothetical protein